MLDYTVLTLAAKRLIAFDAKAVQWHNGFMQRSFQLFTSVFCLLVVGLLTSCHSAMRAESVTRAEIEAQPVEIVTLDGRVQKINVRFALTPAEQQQGLMYISQLPAGHGMIFPMRPPRVAHFWMRNTLVPLDMIFIAPGGVIVKIATRHDTQSDKTTRSDQPVSAVLEIPAGQAAKWGIGVGDIVRHKLAAF